MGKKNSSTREGRAQRRRGSSASEPQRTLSVNSATGQGQNPSLEAACLPPLTRECVRGIVREVVAEFLRQPDVLGQLVEALVQKATVKLQEAVDTNAKAVEDLHIKISAREDEVRLLRESVEARTDELEQYQRRNNVRIFGVLEANDEDTDNIVLSIASKIGVNVTRGDIDRSHRVGTKSGRPRPIIVKFVSYQKRATFFGAKRHLRGSGTTVREDLTAQRLHVLRAAVEKYGLHNVWSQDGVVIVLIDGQRLRITSMQSLRGIEQ
jgi:hypothetical protein